MLKKKSKMCWDFSEEFISNISIIDKNDPSSTFFRYPVTKEKGDQLKSPSEKSSPEVLIEKMKSKIGHVRAVLVVDENETVIETYELRKSMDEKISKALKQGLNDLYCFHAAMRGELTGGW